MILLGNSNNNIILVVPQSYQTFLSKLLAIDRNKLLAINVPFDTTLFYYYFLLLKTIQFFYILLIFPLIFHSNFSTGIFFLFYYFIIFSLGFSFNDFPCNKNSVKCKYLVNNFFLFNSFYGYTVLTKYLCVKNYYKTNFLRGHDIF